MYLYSATLKIEKEVWRKEKWMLHDITPVYNPVHASAGWGTLI